MIKIFTSIIAARDQFGLTWKLLRDARVPKWKKIIPFLPLVYILSPFNLITFAIPIIGPIEDVTLVLLGMKLFEKLVGSHVVQSYLPAQTTA